jgi:hypothetical protein
MPLALTFSISYTPLASTFTITLSIGRAPFALPLAVTFASAFIPACDRACYPIAVMNLKRFATNNAGFDARLLTQAFLIGHAPFALPLVATLSVAFDRARLAVPLA